MKLTNGQTVLLLRPWNRTPELIERKIESVGRKWAYLSGGYRFEIATRRIESTGQRVYLSVAEYEDDRLRGELWRRVKNLHYAPPPGVTSENIKAALRFLGEDVQ